MPRIPCFSSGHTARARWSAATLTSPSRITGSSGKIRQASGRSSRAQCPGHISSVPADVFRSFHPGFPLNDQQFRERNEQHPRGKPHETGAHLEFPHREAHHQGYDKQDHVQGDKHAAVPQVFDLSIIPNNPGFPWRIICFVSKVKPLLSLRPEQ